MLKENLELFLQFEHDNNLFEKNIGGEKFWILIRFELFSKIIEQRGIYSVAHEGISKIGLKDKLRILLKAIGNSVSHYPGFTKRKKFFFYGHSRRKLLENKKWWDIYVDPIINAFDLDYYYLEKTYNGIHFSPAETERVRHNDILEFYARWYSKYAKLKFKVDEQDFLRDLQTKLKGHFDLNIDLVKVLSRKLIIHRIYFRYYQRLFRRIQPSVVFTTVWYNCTSLINAAKKMNIPTVELQHGVITKYNVNYNFLSSNVDLQYFPDFLFTFGEFWSRNISFPIKRENILASGFPFFNLQILPYLDSEQETKNWKTLLFISQGTIGVELSNFASSLVDLIDCNQYKVIYKLHPGESNNWKQRYPQLCNERIDVIDNSQINLYKLINDCDYIVGVYSTAIYEALAFGKRVFLINLPGIEYMEDVLEEKRVDLIYTPEQMPNALSKHNPIDNTDLSNDLFCREWKDSFAGNIDTVLAKS